MARRGRFKDLASDDEMDREIKVQIDGVREVVERIKHPGFHRVQYFAVPGGVPTIYVSTFTYRGQSGVVAFAVAEDGKVLRMRFETDAYAAHRAFGFASHEGHEAYQAHYPGGYRLEWVNNPAHHAGLRAAAMRSEARHKGREASL